MINISRKLTLMRDRLIVLIEKKKKKREIIVHTCILESRSVSSRLSLRLNVKIVVAITINNNVSITKDQSSIQSTYNSRMSRI